MEGANRVLRGEDDEDEERRDGNGQDYFNQRQESAFPDLVRGNLEMTTPINRRGRGFGLPGDTPANFRKNSG